ncbi:hypothetical protein [Streptomyces sp. H39-S7]|uniref:hypothetical protein n=1 Tax=Streptomyces sp. H39-S7 TaxID=3004357 RepID=UPI0022AF62F6|nr:hypothetical protein [Streptomyces sp. H39-S7]MCZ4120975.1 hypothetical protein [Streptomyces sp. H39-S7]
MALIRQRSAAGAPDDNAEGPGTFKPGRPGAFTAERWIRPWARLDPAFGDAGLRALRAAAKAADWPAMSEQLSAVTDGQDLTWLLANVSEVAGIEKWIPAVVAAEPDAPLPRLVSGARHVIWAWEARSAMRAVHVSREQFQLFHERLRVAEELLYEVAEREPEWVAPWHFLLMAGRGLEVGPEISALRFEAATRRYPGHLGSHQQRLQQLCPKWSGSREQLHAFARDSMLAAPEGSPLGELVAAAHLEDWLDSRDDSTVDRLRSHGVIEQLHEAADRSVRHRDYTRPREWARGFNTFAMAFALAGEKAAAAEMFRSVGGTVTQFPWMYLGNPALNFRVWRRRVGA